MFNRKLAVTMVKDKKTGEDLSGETMTFKEIGETIVDTSTGVGTVVIVVASTLTVLRVTEHIVKHIFR